LTQRKVRQIFFYDHSLFSCRLSLNVQRSSTCYFLKFF
jgi:hypothetical protein